MFSPLGSRDGTKKPPRSMRLLLFLCVMMVVASLLLARDLRTGPNPLVGYSRVLTQPRPTGEPVEVLFLDEETEAELMGSAPAPPAPSGAGEQPGG